MTTDPVNDRGSSTFLACLPLLRSASVSHVAALLYPFPLLAIVNISRCRPHGRTVAAALSGQRGLRMPLFLWELSSLPSDVKLVYSHSPRDLYSQVCARKVRSNCQVLSRLPADPRYAGFLSL